MITQYKYFSGRKFFRLFKLSIITILIYYLIGYFSYESGTQPPVEIYSLITDSKTTQMITNNYTQDSVTYNYESFSQWTRTLCSEKSAQRGPHQKIIAVSVYGITSKFTNNALFSWNRTIVPYLKELTREVNELLPLWIIRVYTDYVGSTPEQRELINSYSNVDICDMNNLPIFGSSLLNHLPGRLWRFLPVFDPYVDFIKSHDLDSPMTKREIETLDIWLSNEQTNKFFYIARDHPFHDIPILAGMWGAAPVRARRLLSEAFLPMLTPAIARQHTGAGDQQFLSDFVYNRVRNNSLIFDSFHCVRLGGQPFLSQRLNTYCFVGCIRPCCINETSPTDAPHVKSCPLECRPAEHKTWEYC